MTNTIKTTLAWGTEQLTSAQIDTPRLDAEVLLAYVLKKDRVWLYTHNTDSISPKYQKSFKQLIHRRIKHEPIAYITNQRQFFGLNFYITPHVLIPRPETELIVELAKKFVTPQRIILDIGTGSGCIAIALAHNSPAQHIIATDISAAALAVARKNIKTHRLSHKIQLIQSNLLSSFSGKVDILLSNPPYITTTEMTTLPPTVKNHEPHLALQSGPTGLDHIKQILSWSATHIKPNGVILIEFGSTQGQHILALAKKHCPNAKFFIHQDLAGRDRVLQGNF